jgi:glycosyltransferase involved in cell wall biosynthesis/ADP-heptose:LPS heptosyltransferase/predicted O-methyltransferase YrrM/ubiquinone/menaquinone biosynthesis C-methylase UbiE
MILTPLKPRINVVRRKATYEGISLNEGISLVHELTAQQQYLDALDLTEQLYRQYPQEATKILAIAYDSVYRILREKKSRYWMYQARYFDFQIQPQDKVLDIGSGHMPFPFATHLADYAIEDSQYGRVGAEFKKIEGKPVTQCNVEKMPFAGKEFDFVYCSHVLEHTEKPEQACRELMRIAKRGYIETPSKGKDIFFDSARISHHRWSVDLFDRHLVFTEYCPEEIKGLECDVLGKMVYAPKTEYEKAFYALHFLKADMLNAMLYWEDHFEYEVRRISDPPAEPAASNAVVLPSNKTSQAAAPREPRFSFVMIVLNGMPFIEYSLKSIYEFAHEIIIVEGAVEKCMFAARPDGSSKDGTVEFLRRFPDPKRKIRLIQGRWPEKCPMQNEALKYVTGDYVWLIDSDEVYKREDLEKMKEVLRQDPSITQANFILDNFWKGLDTIFVSDKFFEPAYHCRRLFRYVPGAMFTSHRPPTLQWPGRRETTEQMHLLDGNATRNMGIVLFHYSYVTDEQVRQKVELYQRYGWGKLWNLDLLQWYEQCFRKWTPSNSREIESRWPVWTGDKNSRTQQFNGTHPEVMIEYLIQRTKIRQNGQETVIMRHLIEAAREVKNSFQERPLHALETGTIRTFEELHYSTYFLAKELEGHGKLTTVDINPLSIKRSQNICYELKNISYVLSDSHLYLSGLKNQKLHLVFLDSVNDGDFIFQEFLYVVPWITEGGILIIDDAGILPDGSGKDPTTAAQKGHRVWEFLHACEAEFTVLTSPGGHGTQLKLVLNQQNKQKVNMFLNKRSKLKTENQNENSEHSAQCLKVADESVSCCKPLSVLVPEQELSTLRPETLVPGEYCDLLCQLASQALTAEGDMIEVGVYKGGTLFRLAEHLLRNHKQQFAGRCLIGIDTFAGHPYCDPKLDPAHHFKGRFSDASYEAVHKTFSIFNFVDLYQGECGEIFTRLPAGQRFCLAHIDVDIAQSAIECIEYIYPRLMPGGILVFDEYKNYGQASFIDEFFKDKPVRLVPRWGRPANNYGLVVYKLTDTEAGQRNNPKETVSAPACSQTEPSGNTMPKRLKVAEEYVKKGMKIQEGSAFSEEIRKVFAQYKPKKIIETGTYLGQGTTTIIAEAMRHLGIEGTFFTIEVNPQYYAKAREYLQSKGYPVTALHGLSVPRSLLPSRQEIQKATVETAAGEDLFVDHPEPLRADRYYGETDFPDVPDALLGQCLRQFDGKPDFVLLDSAGHMGFIEFQYLLEHLQGPCIIALDDIDHIKHRRSFRLMERDRRFEILVRSGEKFGFCIARFTPAARTQAAGEPRHILWLRPDAIGDGILASSMLPAIRRRFPSAQLTVMVKDSTAPLYENCSFVDRILHFSEQEMWYDPQFIPAWAEKIRSLGIDCILYSAFSRDWQMDNLVHACGVSQRIGMEGDCSNLPPEQKAQSDLWYTKLIPSTGLWKPELARHADFLKGLGCPDEPLAPTIWLSEEDEAFARRWFEENKVSPSETVVLFAGARTYHRLYEEYGQALSDFAKRHHLTVLTLGSEGDFKTNQENLNPIAEQGIRTINLSGKLSLRQSAAILKRCRLATGAETSLAHMAAALKVPHVILIGGGHFGRFMPYSPLTTLAALPLDCYGCNWKCRYDQEKIYCIRDLKPFVLAEALEQTYQKPSSKPRIFVQDASCYTRSEKGPGWKLFGSWIDLNSVDVLSVSVKKTSPKPTEERPVMQSQPPEFSIVDYPNEFTYSKKRHFPFLQSAALALYGHPVNPATCDLKRYQDLLVFEFIKRHVPKGSRILDVGGGDSRILNHFYRDYECWNIDPLEGAGNGLRQLDPKGRYKLVQDYMGKFNPQLPNDYFDFVFSISALEHAGEDAQTLANIRDDIHRVLKPGGYSFHLFDSVIRPDQVWIHKLVPTLFSTQRTSNRWVEPSVLTADPDLYTMTKAAYEGGWMSVTKQSYESFGKPFSYQVLWQKASVPSADRTPTVRTPAMSAGPSSRPQMPKITVVTPSYNQAPYLEACIQSVLNQGYPNLEYIIMDGGSTDGSVEIIKKYAPYLAYWQSRPDGGQYKAVEDGFARSTGEIMTWLNSDDQYFPDAFEIAAAVFSERPDIEWLTGRVVNFNEDGSVRLIREDIPLWCRAKYLKKDYRSPYLQQEGTFWRRSLWEKAGSCMRTDLHLAGDLELWTRFFRHADLHTLDAALAGYRLQPNRKIATLLERYHQEADRILDEELHQYLNQPTRPPLKAPPPYMPALELCRYRNAFRKTYLHPGGREPMALATSLAPGNIENQQKAVQSWLSAGFLVLSVNSPEEIGKLRPLFPRVCFVATSRNGREYFGKPMIYIDDLFGALKETQFEIVGIINSDIHLAVQPAHLDAIARQTQEAVVCLHRKNVKRLGAEDGTMFVNGFDLFFFRRAMLERIPASRFCLGVAWWDYYVPAVCVLNEIPLVCFQDPIAYHIWHPLNWDRAQWTHAAKYFFERLLELCEQKKGYHAFRNLGPKFCEAWKMYHMITLNDYPVLIIQKSYIYAEFILGMVYGRMKVLDPICPAKEAGPSGFSLPDPSKITRSLLSPSMTLVGVDESDGPLVSAIVSTYQSEAFIGGCLQDLVEQTLYQKGLMEIIVVDSASPQNEAAIVREFQGRYPNIKYIRTPQRETIYAAWNRGIQMARGKYITNANTDDRHAPQMLEMLAGVLEEDPEKAAVYSHFYITETPHQTWTNKTPVRLANWHPPFSRQELLKGNFMGPQPMWRRSLHEEYGYFDPSFKVSGDWEFFLRVSQTHDFVRCRTPLGLYYQNPKSLERSAGTREKEDQFIRRLYSRNRDTVIRRPFDPRTECAFPEAGEMPGAQAQSAAAGPNPLISVCMVAYNTEAYIGRAIESVLGQTYPNFELLIVDDGSTDRTASIIQTYRDRRIRLLPQEHKNFAAGMNHAIQAARGEFVIGVDSDDWIDPDYLSRMAEFAAGHPDYDYYFPEKLTLVDAQGNRTGVEWAYEEVPDSGRLPAILFAKGCSVIPNSGSLKRRSMFDKTGLFRELDNVEDFDFMTRCAAQIRFKKAVGCSGYYYRRLEKSNTVRFEQRHRVTAECLDWMIQSYPPTVLYPGLSEISDPQLREGRFLDYVISVFEKLAQTYRDRSGRIFEEYAKKYRKKRSGNTSINPIDNPHIKGTLQSQLSLAQVHIEQGELDKAAGIYRHILSNKNLLIPTELRESLERLLERLEVERDPAQEVYN